MFTHFLIVNILYAGQMEENVLNFEKQRLSNNKRMQVKEMKIIHLLVNPIIIHLDHH
mgnify:CR=1 FL=1